MINGSQEGGFTPAAFLFTPKTNPVPRKWSNLNLPGVLHFVTAATSNRIPIFTNPANCEIFLQVLSTVSNNWPARLIAYVVMPDHIHLICNPQDGRIKEFSGKVKSLSTIRIADVSQDKRLLRQTIDRDGAVHQLWQESFKDLALSSGWMISQKFHYIHANPVKAGLCRSARDYRWSSFRAYYEKSGEPVKVDHDWWWEDDVEKFTRAQKGLGWLSPDKRIKP